MAQFLRSPLTYCCSLCRHIRGTSLEKYLFSSQIWPVSGDLWTNTCLKWYSFCHWLVSKILLVAFTGLPSLADVLRLCYAFLMSWLLMSSASNLVHVTSYICVRPKHQWGSNHSNNPVYVKFALTFLTVFSNEWVPAWTTICSVAIIVAVSSVLTRIRVTRIKGWQINQRKHT